MNGKDKDLIGVIGDEIPIFESGIWCTAIITGYLIGIPCTRATSGDVTLDRV